MFRSRKNGSRRGKQRPRGVPLGPSQFRTNIEVKHQYRFASTSAVATAVNGTNLLTACGVSATTAVIGSPIFDSVKLNAIEIWTPPATQGSSVTCSVLFPSTANNPAREVTDTSVSVTQPAHVKTSPPFQSTCSFWTNGNTGGTLCTLVAPPGSIIDVWVSLILKDGTQSAANQATLVGATVGVIYYCSLDSQTKAGSIYQPIGLTSL